MQNQTKTEVDNSSVHSKLTGLSSLRENGFRGLKTIVYALQALLVFIAWILALVVLTKSGTTGSASKFYFTLVRYPHLIHVSTSELMWTLDLDVYSCLPIPGSCAFMAANSTICECLCYRRC